MSANTVLVNLGPGVVEPRVQGRGWDCEGLPHRDWVWERAASERGVSLCVSAPAMPAPLQCEDQPTASSVIRNFHAP